MTCFLRNLACLLVLVGSAHSYQPSSSNLSRRDWFAFAAAATTVTLFPGEQPANAVLSSKYCAYGSGQDCDDLAEGSEFIRELQAKSAANKEKNVQVRKNAL